MDNAYFIGYRIDIEGVDCEEWSTDKLFKAYGIDEYCPGSEWMAFPKASGEGWSLLWMNDMNSEYRCPIDREELWSDLHNRTFDFPDDGIDISDFLSQSGLFQTLLNAYGDDVVTLRWGIFLCLG